MTRKEGEKNGGWKPHREEKEGQSRNTMNKEKRGKNGGQNSI
jgi:hypothetical protein